MIDEPEAAPPSMADDLPINAQAQVTRAAKDVLLKRLAQSLRGGFVAGLGLNLAPIVELLPSEVPVLAVHSAQTDLLCRLADAAILHLEFQMTSTPGDLPRFARYNFAVCETYDAITWTVGLYGPGISDAPTTLDRGSHIFTVRNIYLGQRDGEAVVARLREVTDRAGELSPLERLDIMLLPLMGQSRPLPEILREVAELARALPQPVRDEVVGTMVGLAYNYLEPALAEGLLEVLRMANALQNALENLVADTLVKGRQEDILSVLATRLGPIPEEPRQRVEQVSDPAVLRELLRVAATVTLLAEFEDALARI